MIKEDNVLLKDLYMCVCMHTNILHDIHKLNFNLNKFKAVLVVHDLSYMDLPVNQRYIACQYW